MTESAAERLSRATAEALQHSLERWQQRLHEAEVQAPANIYRMIEALREVVSQDSRKARQQVLDILTRMGTSEAEFLDWLEQDFELLEKRLFTALGVAADPTALELDRLRRSRR